MDFFDQIFYKVLTYYQDRAGKGQHARAVSKAILYISLLEASLVFLLAALILKLVGRNYAFDLTAGKFWTSLILTSIGIYLFNVLQYNGRRRMKIKSRLIGRHKKTTQIIIFWVVPLALIALTLILLKAF